MARWSVREVILETINQFRGVSPGCNGPRLVPDNGLRNAAHWTIAFAWAYRQTGAVTFKEQMLRLLEKITSPELRPYGYSFLHIPNYHSPGNGLIGQAWVLEALLTASSVLEDQRYADLAHQVFSMHPFCLENALWHVRKPDGDIAPVHTSLNQQIWFAAMGAMLVQRGYREHRETIQKFLDRLESHMHILSGGLLGMKIAAATRDARLDELITRIRRLYHRLRGKSVRPLFSYRETSVGYHAFTLYGLALLKDAYPQHAFWRSRKLLLSCEWGFSENHKRALKRNRFAMGYNPSGFEIPFAMQSLVELDEDTLSAQSEWWLSEQIGRHFNPTTGQFDRSTADAATLTARVYEATRLRPVLLDMYIRSPLVEK
jgi:hypothetical protein